MDIFTIGAILVGLSALFGYLNHKLLGLPHTIGLVVFALLASLVVIGMDLVDPAYSIAERLTGMLRQVDFNETLMHGMLSFLLFAGALHADMSALKSRRITIAVMAVVGTLISTFTIGFGLWLVGGWIGLGLPLIWALVFGALISPTDPVAVLSLFKTVNVPQTLEAKITGESLFNDGIGVVVFTILLEIAMAGGEGGVGVDIEEAARVFLQEAAGGAVMGGIGGYLAYRAMRSIDEASLEVLISLALVMVTFALALALEMSGPIAMVVAGLFIGNHGVAFAMSENTRRVLLGFWALVDEILNSILFLLIGLEVLVVAGFADHWEAALIAIPLALIARTLSVAIPIAFIGRWVRFDPGTIRILIWGGLRGGIAVALSLSLPANEYKPTILGVTYAVVLFSIIVQGLTVKPLVDRLMRPRDEG
jgi:CPA1 family monovalent cation:H+ antiporter